MSESGLAYISVLQNGEESRVFPQARIAGIRDGKVFIEEPVMMGDKVSVLNSSYDLADVISVDIEY